MFKIAEIARFFGMTPRMLRHYEKLGLLRPAVVDASSRYRYYDRESYDRLAQIADFKALGLGLEEIEGYFSGRVSAEEVAEDLERRIGLLERKREMMLKHSKSKQTGYEVERGVFGGGRCVERVVRGETLEDFIGEVYEFYADAIRGGVVMHPEEGNYFEWERDEFRFEDMKARCRILLAEGTDAEGAKRVRRRRVIRTVHRGKLGDLPGAFGALAAYAKREGVELKGRPMFVNLEGSYREMGSYCISEAMWEVEG